MATIGAMLPRHRGRAAGPPSPSTASAPSPRHVPSAGPPEGPVARRSGQPSPRSSSIRRSWLYLATRSLRAGAPVLIWPQLVATARSAMVVSSVSPERWDMTDVYRLAAARLDRLQRLGERTDLVDLDQDRIGDPTDSMPRASRSVLVTNRSSPTSWQRARRCDAVWAAQPSQSSSAMPSSMETIGYRSTRSAEEVDHLGSARASGPSPAST